jgi:hypothetical protein
VAHEIGEVAGRQPEVRDRCLRRQNPIALAGAAWWPGGRVAQKAASASPARDVPRRRGRRRQRGPPLPTTAPRRGGRGRCGRRLAWGCPDAGRAPGGRCLLGGLLGARRASAPLRRSHVGQGETVHPGRASVGPDPPPRLGQDVIPTDAVKQGVEAPARDCLAAAQAALEFRTLSTGRRPPGWLGRAVPAMPLRLPPSPA